MHLQGFTQSLLKGVVLYQNSGGKPAVGIQVSAFGANPQDVYTTSNGFFVLSFKAKKPGEKVKIILGSTDEKGKNIELVNNKQLEMLRIPSNPDDDPIEIIICPTGQKDETALRFYEILAKATKNESAAKKDNIEKLKQESNQETVSSLVAQMDKLSKEKDAALNKLREQAEFIASINTDNASEIVKEAIRSIEKEKDIETALEILNNLKLEKTLQLAINKKNKGEEEIREVIEGYALKVRLLSAKLNYSDAIICFEKIIEIYNTTRLDETELAFIYGNTASVCIDDGEYSKALEFEQKSITIFEKEFEPNNPILALAYNNLAVIYTHLRDYGNALVTQQKALKIQLQSDNAKSESIALSYNNLAGIYLGFGRIAEESKAVDDKMKKILKHNIITPNSYIIFLCDSLGGYEKALLAQQKALEIQEKISTLYNENLALFYNTLSLIYEHLKEHEKALEAIKKAIAINIHNHGLDDIKVANNYYNQSYIYFGKNDLNNAITYGLKAYQIFIKKLRTNHPDLEISKLVLSIYYNKRGQQFEQDLKYKMAIEDFTHAVELSPTNSDLNFRLGQCFYYEKDFQKAIIYLKRSQQLVITDFFDILNNSELGYDEKLFEYLNLISLAYAKNKNFKDSKLCIEEMQKLVPKIGVVYRNWAVYYIVQNKNDEAISNLQKAIEMGYDDLGWIKTEESLDKIRGMSIYKKIIKRLEENKKI